MQFARIKWLNNQPYSIDFNDVYFSSENGLQETEYVYIDKNNLVERFKNLNTSTFTIIETGFGTGLNFLAIANCWLEFAPNNAKLQFISIEKHPLNLGDLIKSHRLWPQFSTVSQELIQQYQTLKHGCNNFIMAAGRIHIALWVCDVKEALATINQTANAWVLDGFAPAINQDMWSQKVFEHIARLSQLDTSFATFTSAGHVRRGLQTVGFKCTKHVGFGKKREMLSGLYTEKMLISDVSADELIINNNCKSKLL